MNKNVAFGIDFGTSKTVLTRSMSGGKSPSNADIEVNGKRRNTTCLLQVDSETLIGETALQEYFGSMDGSRRERFVYADNFKPDLPSCSHAERRSGDFWRTLAAESKVAQELKFYGEAAVTVIGRPASWDDAASAKLIAIARAAGFPAPISLPEPVGALFHFLASQLRAEHCKRTILVVDFGAGTLDFTTMRNGDLGRGEHWGSNHFGGEIFDDLFFTWFLEQVETKAKTNPDLQSQLNAVFGRTASDKPLDANVERLFRTQTARETKERYSDWLRTNPQRGGNLCPAPTFSHEALDVNLGRLRSTSPDEFYTRVRAYRPSSYMLGKLKGRKTLAVAADQPYLNAMFDGRAIDLLAWGRDLINQAVRSCGSNPRQTLCILTGGGTRWPWFKKMIQETGIFEDLYILQDSEPEMTIGRGLGRAYQIGVYADGQRTALAPVREEIARSLADGFLAPKISELAKLVQSRVLIEARLCAIENAMRPAADLQCENRNRQAASKASGVAFDAAAAKAHLDEIEKASFAHVVELIRQGLNDEELRREITAQVLAWEAEAESFVYQQAAEKRIELDGLLGSALGAAHLPKDGAVAEKVGGILQSICLSPVWWKGMWLALFDRLFAPSAEKLTSRYREQIVAEMQRLTNLAVAELLAPRQWAAQIVAHLDDSLGRLAGAVSGRLYSDSTTVANVNVYRPADEAKNIAAQTLLAG